MAKREVRVIFPEELIREPLIYRIGHEFKVVTNIKRANVTRDSGWVVLEIEGDSEEIDRVVSYLRTKGVKVEVVDSSEHIDL
ncbi:MAG: NIL domain-containing protein [bacterium]